MNNRSSTILREYTRRVREIVTRSEERGAIALVDAVGLVDFLEALNADAERKEEDAHSAKMREAQVFAGAPFVIITGTIVWPRP